MFGNILVGIFVVIICAAGIYGWYAENNNGNNKGNNKEVSEKNEELINKKE